MHYVIAGLMNCSLYAYCTMVAQRLKEQLPDFHFRKIAKKENDWERWLEKTCKENEWYHIESPLVWKEPAMVQGKKYYVGNADRFLDVCRECYNLPPELSDWKQKEMTWFKDRTEADFHEDVDYAAKIRREYRCRQVCITGAGSPAADILIMELLNLPLQARKDGLEIRLFDDTKRERKLTSMANDAKYCRGMSGLGSCRVVTDLDSALSNVDLVIVLDAFHRTSNETIVKWLKRNRNAMAVLGTALNQHARQHCRVIIAGASNQPLCYNATVLASYATKLHVRNIVAVTQDLGREVLSKVTQRVNLNLRDLYCPPVWGFVGLNKFVAVRRTIHNHTYKVPGKRHNSTLPQGHEMVEIRSIQCVLEEEEKVSDIFRACTMQKTEAFPRLGRLPCLGRVTAILDLLKVWYLTPGETNGEILCLGVYSDGTFGIPEGVYWSQPVSLVNDFWTPFADFPVPSKGINLHNLFALSIASLYRTKVTPRIHNPAPTPAKESKTHGFDLGTLKREMEQPVIRTEDECVKHLKYLAKKEFGLDLSDEYPLTIPEEEFLPELEPAAVKEKLKFWCECWREELKTLKEELFVRSLSSEVEVNLSTNESGTELSIINPYPPRTTAAPRSLQSESSSSSYVVCRCVIPEGVVGCSCNIKEIPGEAFEEYIPWLEEHKDTNESAASSDTSKNITQEHNISWGDASDRLGKHYGFYGKTDAVRDDAYERQMKERIQRYEQEGKMTEDEEEISKEEEILNEEVEEEEEMITKFHARIDGAPNEIVGDTDGLAGLAEREPCISHSTLDMYSDEIRTTLVLPDTEEEEDEEELTISELTESAKESDLKEEGLEESVRECAGYCLPEQEEVLGEESYTEAVKADDKTKRPLYEGVPLCYICKCILPEGLLGCPCGASTVVEVFRKESISSYEETESTISMHVEIVDKVLPPESIVSGSTEESVIEDEDVLYRKRDIFNLPPESFLPFTPKPKTKIEASKRPPELCKEFLDELRPPKPSSFPGNCSSLFRDAENEFGQNKVADVEEKMAEKAERERRRTVWQEKMKGRGVDLDQDGLSTIFEESELDEGELKKEFSNLHMMTPHEIEEWRATVRSKYRKWFEEGIAVKDDSYYSIAVQDVSDDEMDIDTQLSHFLDP